MIAILVVWTSFWYFDENLQTKSDVYCYIISIEYKQLAKEEKKIKEP